MSKQDIIQAGKIASEVKDYARKLIKPDMSLLEIAEKIESKIQELGGEPAFPTNLSINEIAAHYTPSHNDESKASGLLKVDFGVHINGYLADTAFSIDLENSNENKKLIQAAEAALENASKEFEKGKTTSEIGEVIEKTISEKGFQPIINLSGHSMEEYDLHAGITIPNINDERRISIEEGLYAIEPFSTTGSGKVQDGNPSGIYQLQDNKKPRSPKAREVLEFIEENYSTLPFCSRWLVKKFTPTVILALRELEQNQNLHQYPQLVESSHAKVAQAENTILINDEKIITTK
jgi:methionyl aminopeptidase